MPTGRSSGCAGASRWPRRPASSASALGVLPWAQGEAEQAAARCFADWLQHRGGTVPAEIAAGMRQVRLFLEQHGSSRFELAWLDR